MFTSEMKMKYGLMTDLGYTIWLCLRLHSCSLLPGIRTAIFLWRHKGTTFFNPAVGYCGFPLAYVAISKDKPAYGGSIQYFSQRYFTAMGGKIFACGLMPCASKNALSLFNHRRNVSTLTPAAMANSNLLHAFILDTFHLSDEIRSCVASHFSVHVFLIAIPSPHVV